MDFAGSPSASRASAPPTVDDGLVRHLLRRYGKRGAAVDRAISPPSRLRRVPVVSDLPYRRIEITRAAEGEMAETLDDVLRRRVPISFRHADGGTGAAADVGALMGAALGWDADETARAVERYCTGIAEESVGAREPPAQPGVHRLAASRA